MIKQLTAFFKRRVVQQYLVLIGLISGLVLLRDFKSLLFLTIIFSYLGLNLGLIIHYRFPKIPYRLCIVLLFLTVAAIFITSLVILLPTLVAQLTVMPHAISSILHNLPTINHMLQHGLNSVWHLFGTSLMTKNGLNTLDAVINSVVYLTVAYLLGFIYCLTYKRMQAFGRQFLNSSHTQIFGDLYDYAHRYVLILGRVIETQLVISMLDTAMLVIALLVMRIPNVLILGLLSFIFGLVPLVGMLLMMVPLILFAYVQGGWVLVLLMVMAVGDIHLFEAYFLHPRLMASNTSLPVFVTFVVMIVAGRLFGPWGMLLGLPTVLFAMDLLGVQEAQLSQGKLARTRRVLRRWRRVKDTQHDEIVK